MSTAQDFHMFSCLPVEIRFQVWKLCLPRHRVVEIDRGYQLMNEDNCGLYQTACLNSLLPVLACVCHESRQIVFETYRRLTESENGPYWGADTSFHSLWANPATDVIHLNWLDSYSASYQDSGDDIPYVVHLAAQCQGGSFMADRLGTFTSLPHSYSLPRAHDDNSLPRDYHDPDDFAPFLGQAGKYYSACLKTICIHATWQQAASSGVFGRLAEERVQLVDASDADGIATFHHFAKTLEKNDLDTDEKWAEIMDPDFVAEVKEWNNSMESAWCYYMWHLPPAKQVSEIEIPRNIYMSKRSAPEAEKEDEEGRDHYARRFISLLDVRLDKSLSWVQRALESMPRFRPTVMFRLCTSKECKTSDAAWREYQEDAARILNS